MSLYYKARIFMDMKYYKQAEQIYRELLAEEPGFENGLLDLAYIYEVTDRPREAEKTYKRFSRQSGKRAGPHQAWQSLHAGGQGQ